jgi:predicted tellurium resistance membrane protein TerC
LVLLAKSTKEIHHSVEGGEHALTAGRGKSFGIIVGQIMLMDIVFSIDSVITAIGMAESVTVMILAVVLSMIVMLMFAGRISDFVHRHPTVKMLALSFLLLIGMSLVAEGLHFHVPKGYIYFAMAFSLGVEVLNIRSKVKAARLKAAADSAH